METLELLKRRIDTVGELRSVVRTMKALSAVSSRQYEGSLSALRDYQRTVEMGLHIVLRGTIFHSERRAFRRAPEALGAVIFGSDVGLCGRFNEQLVDLSIDKMNGFQVAWEARRILAVGTRIDARLGELRHPVEETFIAPGSPAGITLTIRQILLKFDDWRGQGIEDVLLFYSQASQPRMLHVLPVDLRHFQRLVQERWPSRVLPGYTMSAERLLAALIREHLFVSLFRTCAESLSSEHQMRLRSMQAAEKNIDTRLNELQAAFRHQRQNSITTEIFDIVAGFEAVSGPRSAI